MDGFPPRRRNPSGHHHHRKSGRTSASSSRWARTCFSKAFCIATGATPSSAAISADKRTAFVACFTFLRLNGCNLRPEPKEGVRMMEELASSVVSETSFASWLRAMAQKSASEA